MTGLIDKTPTISIVLENPFAGIRFPSYGEALAVLDTGYEGFLSVPDETYHELNLNLLESRSRSLSLANGQHVISQGSYANLRLPEIGLKVEGLVETYPGLDEILMGTAAARRLRILLDYCSGVMQLERCR